MNILIGIKNDDIAVRWKSILGGKHRLSPARNWDELKASLALNTFDLIMLHLPLLEDVSSGDLRMVASDAKLFLLSDTPDHEEGFAFLKLGIVGYGNTYISAPRLAEAVHVISSGGVWLGQKVIQQLILEAHRNSRAGNAEKLESVLSCLTKTERLVAELVAQGETNLEIADELKIAERTVKAHLTSIYDKLHIGNRLSLALLVNRGGVR